MKKQKKAEEIRALIIEHVKNNSKDYTILLLIFIIGVVVGVMFINYVSEEQKQEIYSYINNFIMSIKENKVINKTSLLKDAVIKNAGLAICLWFIGSTVTLIPLIYGIVLLRGFYLGYTIASTIGVLGTAKGIVFSLSALLLQNIIIIPAMLGLAVSGIKLYKIIIKNKRRENIKGKIFRTHNFL